MAQPFDPAGLRTAGEAFPIASDVRIIGVSRTAAFSAAPNGLIVYQTGSVGRNALTWFDRSGKPGAVLDDANTYGDIELAPDGKSIAATRLEQKNLRNSLWVTDLARGITSRLTAETENVEAPTWSPDGKRIAYHDMDSTQLYARDATGSGNRELLTSGSRPHWSPDGKTLVFVEGIFPGRLALTDGLDHKPVPYLDLLYLSQLQRHAI